MTEAWLGDRDDPGGGLRKSWHILRSKRGSGPGRRASWDRSRPRDKGLQRADPKGWLVAWLFDIVKRHYPVVPRRWMVWKLARVVQGFAAHTQDRHRVLQDVCCLKTSGRW